MFFEPGLQNQNQKRKRLTLCTATHGPRTRYHRSTRCRIHTLSWVELRPTLPNVQNQHPEEGFVLYTHAARQQRAAVVTPRSQLTQGWLL